MEVVEVGPPEVVVVVVAMGGIDVVGVVDGGTVVTAAGAFDEAGSVEVVVVVVVSAAPVSGLTHPAGGVPEPACPGMSTVPAQPKSDKVDSLTAVEPSENFAVEMLWRM